MAYSVGVSWNDFWNMNPRIINLHIKGHNEKAKERDEWVHTWVGTYGISAFSTILSHAFSKTSQAKFIEQPITKELRKKKKITKEQRTKMENEKLAMTLKVMQVNWELNKSEKKEGEMDEKSTRRKN